MSPARNRAVSRAPFDPKKPRQVAEPMTKIDQRLEQLSPLQRAMFALKETQDRLDALQRRQTEPIAIVGMACRFPGGADDPEAFWQLLRDGVNAVREIPAERWDVDEFYDSDPQAPGKMNTRWGGFIDGIEYFDNHFFGISDREASRVDPQQRILLELSWEALEDAGLPPSSLRGSKTGVFIGIGHSEYGILQSTDLSLTDAFVGTGTAPCIAANRISFSFDFSAPSVAVDTACSSALVAVHLACQSLRSGESELALAGGVNMILSPLATVNLTKAGFSAADGRIHAFDASATGYVRGEGAGVVVLKPLALAIRDRDPIYAVIRGSAVNQNGFSNGLTAPSRQAQERVLRQACAAAKLAPSDIQYVETQGTGTRMGDAIEASALGAVVGQAQPDGKLLAIGSVKTNIGHLEAASGIASLMKVALAMRHQQFPATLNFEKPNPEIPFEQLRIKVQQGLEPWPAPATLRCAGVSAFGFGGSNAHVVLQDAPAPVVATVGDDATTTQGLTLLTLSARTDKALRAQAEQFAQFLEGHPPAWRDVCYTAAARRDHHACRMAVLAESAPAAAATLRQHLAGATSPNLLTGRQPFGRDLKVAVLYDGDLRPWRAAHQHLAGLVLRLGSSIAQADQALQAAAGWNLATMLAESASWDDPARALPAVTAIQIALADWWRRAGVEPQAVIVSGIGELAGAVAAGVLNVADAIGIAVAIGRGQEIAPESAATTQAATIPLFSAVDGRQLKGLSGEASRWRQREATQITEPAIAELKKRGVDATVRLNPESRCQPIDQPTRQLDEASRGSDQPLRDALAQLHALGAELRWQEILKSAERCVRIPTYPWQRQRLWVNPQEIQAQPGFASKPVFGPLASISQPAPTGLAAGITLGSPLAGLMPDESQPLQTRPDLNTPYVAPRTPLEQTLADAWSEILRIDRVGMHDNFFELGGDSLQAMMLHNALQDRLGEVVLGYVLFQSQTIDDLAGYLRSHFAEAVLRLHPDEPNVGEREVDEPSAEVGEQEVSDVRRLVDMLAPIKPINYPIRKKNRRAVFLLSPPRSGSTLFRVMLAGHDRLFSPPELELLCFNTLTDRRDEYANVPGQWLEGLVRTVMETHGCSVEAARQRMQDWEQNGTPIQEVYREFQEQLGDRILVDKTPSYAGRLQFLERAEELFDEPLYLHLLRHPCGMIRSYTDYNMHEAFQIRFKVDEPIPFSPRQIAELVWVVSHQNILKLFEKVPAARRHRVRFEDAVGRPEATMRGVCDFLGLDYQSEMIYPYDHPERKMVDGVVSQDRMHGDQKFLVKHKAIDPKVANAWREHLTGDFLGGPARALAAEFGYDDLPPKRQESAVDAVVAEISNQALDARELLANLDQLSDQEVERLLMQVVDGGNASR